MWTAGTVYGWIPAHGTTLLMVASYAGHIDCVRELVLQGADINLQRESGTTALFFAAQQGHNDVVRFLFEFGASTEFRTKDGGTALLAASQYGHKRVVETLLKHGADIHDQLHDGATALFLAAQGGYLDVIRLLLSSGAKVNQPRQEPTRSRVPLRGLQFPWVSSRKQEKILFHLEFTILYLGAYLTQIQARRKTRTLTSDLHLPHSVSRASFQHERGFLFSHMENFPCGKTENPPIKSFSLPWMVHLFFSGATPLHIMTQCSHKQALWGHKTREILPKMSACSNLLICIPSQKKSYHILHETKVPKNDCLWGILDTRIEEWEKCL
ncbi:ankyrin repeat domain-containing protein 29 isoform X1 [Meles meles]|uniref:ankyrin repeat domain-containing protein 29 isoform X1 n=1 Tax=Meles meles TaxID=9662 RepID=UPI001E69F1E5|nr:ankyrin repeat domain-containing protein 29 isoform X1 [Meles meles]